MKKLSFALACAASVAAFADLPNVIGFEDYTAGFTGLSLKTDAGGEGAATDSFWLYTGASGSQDGSTVKAYGGDNLAAPTTGNAAGNNYLELSTEGGTLWRSVNTLTDGTTLGTAQAIDATKGIYVDTMVQFTPTEDGGTPEVTAADKLAIWLNVDSSGQTPVTNLMVRASLVDDNGTASSCTPTNFVLTTAAPVEAGTWYRLTVKSISDVDQRMAKNSAAYNTGLTGFQIYLDGNLLTSSTSSFSSGYMSLALDASEYGWLNQATDKALIDLLEGGSVFASLAGFEMTSTLQAVGFKGSGALDNLGITDTDPLPPAPASDLDFTITAPANTTVEWSKDNGVNWTTYAAGAKAPAGDILIRLTNADGAVKTVTKTLAATGDTLDASSETFGWADYLGAADAGAYVIDSLAKLQMFQKGVTANLATAGVTFKQTANIDMASAGAWNGIGGDGKDKAPFFEGIYDGNGMTISNLTLARAKYRGFFDSVKNATIKDLTINVAGLAAGDSEAGFAAFVGSASGTTLLQRLTANGSIGTSAAYSKHTTAGIAVSFGGVIDCCTNNATIYAAIDNTKAGGMIGIAQGSATILSNCVNTAAITANQNGGFVEGVGGIVGYNAVAVTLVNCVNTGVITDETSAGRAGELIGHVGAAVTGVQCNTGRAAGVPFGLNSSTVTGFDLAYLDNGTAGTAEYYAMADMYDVIMAKVNMQTGVVPGAFYAYALQVTASNMALVPASLVAGTFTADAGSPATTETLTTLLTPFLSARNGKAEVNPDGAPAGAYYDLVYQTGSDPKVWTVAADTLAGSGTEADPWVIDSVQHLKVFRMGVNAGTYALETQYFVQTADIDLQGESWTGIGANFTDKAFCGHYDGQNHTISNLEVGTPNYAGLFSTIIGGSIKNLKILGATSKTGASAVCVGLGDIEPPTGKFFLAENVTVGGTMNGAHNVGGLASWTQGDVRFVSCTNLANCTTTRAKVGGLTPIHAAQGPLLVSNCCNKGAITLNKNANGDATFAVGGLVGYTQGALPVTIVDSVNEGAVSGLWTESTSVGTSVVGGIFGLDSASVTLTIRNCSNTGAVSANVASCATQNAKVGGIVGAVGANTKLHLEDVIAAGSVSATVAEGRTAKVGAFAGEAFAYNESTQVGLWLMGKALTALPQFSETLATVGGYTGTTTDGDYTVYGIAAPAYPTYIDASDTEKKAKYDAWKATYGADTGSAYEKAFLLNVSPVGTAAADAEAAFEILSITINADGSATVVTTLGPATGKTYNGTIEIRGSATLTGEYTTGAVEAKTAKFFKAFLK